MGDAPNSITLNVRDTDSALEHYHNTDQTKPITMDGVVFSYLQIAAGLQKLFPGGVIDRTDLRGACKNSP